MLQHVQADAGIRTEMGQIGELRVDQIKSHGLQVGLIPESLPEPVDALRLRINRNDEFAIMEHPGKVSDATTYLDHSRTEFSIDEPPLPRKVILRQRHLLLIRNDV